MKSMNEGTLSAIVIPSATVLAGILINNHKISDLHSRISDLQHHMDRRCASIEGRLDRVAQLMDTRLTRIEDVLKLR